MSDAQYRTFKENIGELASRAYEEDQRLGEGIKRRLPSFPDYVSAVFNMEHMMQLGRLHDMSTEDYQDMVTRLDRTRKIKHDAVVDNCNILNRMADRLGVERFCPSIEDADGDPRIHRKMCADFCGDIVLETFEGRDGRELSKERQAKMQSWTDQFKTPSLDAAATRTYGTEEVQEAVATMMPSGPAEDLEASF